MTSSRRALAAAAAGALLLLGPTCTDYEAGIAVEVVLLHHDGQRGGEVPQVHRAGAPRRFTTDLGYDVELDRGYLVVQQVQLVECRPAAGRAGAAGWHRLWPRGLVHAHEQGGDPTLLDAPYVDSALRADFALAEVGVVEPPPGRYCQVRVAIGPADRDALGLPGDVDMLGRSLHLEGWYRPSGTVAAIPFAVESSEERELLLPLVDAEGGRATPLLLDGDRREARLAIAGLTNFWLDGVDLAGDDTTALGRRALDAVVVTLHHDPGR